MTSGGLPRRARSALFKALRAAFRVVPMSEATRDTLRSRFLRSFPTVRPLLTQGQIGHSMERRPRVRADERCIGYVEYSEELLPDPLPATLVAFYLPQFHTISENDEWWGKGFTEWRNVTRALPQFEGHLQPRLPGDLGFYDLRNRQVMRDQAKLAKTYGLSAFCFYFYWFGGKTLLEDPLRSWLADKSIDFQYCLCWANESWTRRWDGRDDEVLIAQNHSSADDIEFIEHVSAYLRDPRYLRLDGKPVLLLYRPTLLPDPRDTASRWRAWCRDNGIGEIHLAYVQSFERPDPSNIGFDAAVEFPPNLRFGNDITPAQQLLNDDYRGQVLQWRSMAQGTPYPSPYPMHPGVNPGWDNEPRRPGAGRSWVGATPGAYAKWLRHVVGRDQGPVFINAWNEWAEGAVLEPDARHGYAYLHATRQALQASASASLPKRPCIVVHAWYLDILEEILEHVERAASGPMRLIITTDPARVAAVEAALRKRACTAEVVGIDNRGRDILPFLTVASRLHREGETAVLKLHTKVSPHRQDGDQWRASLVSALLHDGIAATHERFGTDARLGLLVPTGHRVPLSYYWGANAATVKRLSYRLGLEPPTEAGSFASGSMYWVRLAALQPLFDALAPSDFEPEAGQVDGTLAHAIERLVLHCVLSHGMAVDDIGPKHADASDAYRYAPR